MRFHGALRGSGKRDDLGVKRIEGGVERARDAFEAFEQGGCGSVEVLVGHNVDAAIADSAEVLPVSLCDDSFERNAIAGAAPGKKDYVGISGGDLIGVVWAPGVPRKRPFAVATSSATQPCERMRGFPHSSQ